MKAKGTNVIKLVLVAGFGLLSSQIALAEGLGASKVGARAGLVDVDGIGSTLGMGAFGEMPVTNALSIRPSIDYWQKSSGEDVGLAEIEITVSDLALGGAVKYTLQMLGVAAKPYLVGGLAMHRLSAEVKTSNAVYGSDQSYKSSDMEFGLDLGGGVSYPLSKSMELNGEILLRNVDAADVMTITGGLAYSL